MTLEVDIKKTSDNRTVARETTTTNSDQRGTLEDFARQKFETYRHVSMLSIPEEVVEYFDSIGIHAGWVAVHRQGRLAEMTQIRGYRQLNENDLPPQFRPMMSHLKRPDGAYSSKIGDLVLMVVPKDRNEEIRLAKQAEAEEQIDAANRRLVENADFYNNSKTRIEVGKRAPRARAVKTQKD